jgi:hypothetical protein
MTRLAHDDTGASVQHHRFQRCFTWHDPGTLLILTTMYRRGVDCSTFAAVVVDVLVAVDGVVGASIGRTVTSTRLPT